MRAWILGAGFSVRLGGPTLNNLLSDAALERLRRAQPQTWLAKAHCTTCVSLLSKGKTEGLWTNAEDYIAALGSCDPQTEQDVLRLCGDVANQDDFACNDDPAARLTNNLYCTAIALVAAQCMHFVDRSADDLEGWLPYDRWVRSLPPDDVLITFNYDEVVEQAFKRNEKRLSVPNQRLGHELPIKAGKQVLLKLHGGVNVRDTILSPPEPNNIANLDRNPAMIAVPGISKDSDTDTNLDRLWEAASERLARADQISIVGYSCPASDEKAKALLLDSLGRNPNRPAVDVVLGPANPTDAQRLVALLRSIDLDVRDAGMWAQDYLSAQGVGMGWQTLDCRA